MIFYVHWNDKQCTCICVKQHTVLVFKWYHCFQWNCICIYMYIKTKSFFFLPRWSLWSPWWVHTQLSSYEGPEQKSWGGVNTWAAWTPGQVSLSPLPLASRTGKSHSPTLKTFYLFISKFLPYIAIKLDFKHIQSKDLQHKWRDWAFPQSPSRCLLE